MNDSYANKSLIETWKRYLRVPSSVSRDSCTRQRGHVPCDSALIDIDTRRQLRKRFRSLRRDSSNGNVREQAHRTRITTIVIG